MGESPPCKRLKITHGRVTFDVCGTLVKVSRHVLGYLGRCDLADRMDEVDTDEAIQLEYPPSIFDEFHCALVSARRDALAATRTLIQSSSLTTPRGFALKDMLDFLGYSWLLGEQFKPPLQLRLLATKPLVDGRFSHKYGWQIGRVWELLAGGILHDLSAKGKLVLHRSHSELHQPSVGDIALLSELYYANTPETYIHPVLLRPKPVKRFDRRLGRDVEYFIPHLPGISNGMKRWIIDVGPGHLVKLERIVLAVTGVSFGTGCAGDEMSDRELLGCKYRAMPGHFDKDVDAAFETRKVSGTLAAANGFDVEDPEQTARVNFDALVICRQHTVVAQKRQTKTITKTIKNPHYVKPGDRRQRWANQYAKFIEEEEDKTVNVAGQYVEAKSTCSLIQVKVPEELSSSFISRAFTFSLGQRDVVVHACELFGTLFQVPENVDTSGDRAPYLFDQLSLKQISSNLGRHELARLRNMGLVSTSENLPEEDDGVEPRGDDEGDGDEEDEEGEEEEAEGDEEEA